MDFFSVELVVICEMVVELEVCCGVCWVDVLVFGGMLGVESGSLVIMVGGCVVDIECLWLVFF